MDRPTIVAVDMEWRGFVVTLPAPAQHSDMIHAVAQSIPESEWPVSGNQGFLTSEGRFVGRNDAMELARAAGQVQSTADALYSEDLW